MPSVFFFNFARIIPNPSYDKCVLNPPVNTDSFTRDSCPPGPFKCKSTGGQKLWSTARGWKIATDKWMKELVMEPVTKCCQVNFPLGEREAPGTATTTPEPTLQEKQEKFLKDVTIRTQKV